jgi:hypothetical protein
VLIRLSAFMFVASITIIQALGATRFYLRAPARSD